MNKFIQKSKHVFMMCYSRSYRKKQHLQKGRKVWNRLNKKLPVATGHTIDDDERLEKFKKEVLFLMSFEKKYLSNWLKHQLRTLEQHSEQEPSTPKEEKHKKELKKIYREHLKLLN